MGGRSLRAFAMVSTQSMHVFVKYPQKSVAYVLISGRRSISGDDKVADFAGPYF